MDKTPKEEAVYVVSEMDSLLNRLRGMFLGLECTLKKALTTIEKERALTYCELLATSPSTQSNSQEIFHPAVQPSDRLPQTVGLIVKAADPNTSSHEVKNTNKRSGGPKGTKIGSERT
jgi:hypothetical protein